MKGGRRTGRAHRRRYGGNEGSPTAGFIRGWIFMLIAWHTLSYFSSFLHLCAVRKISYRSRNRVTAQRNIKNQHRDKHAHLLPLHPPSRCRNNPPKTMTGQRAAFANIFGVIDDVIPSVSCSLDFKYRNSFLVPTASSCRLLITCVRECAAAACGINNIA